MSRLTIPSLAKSVLKRADQKQVTLSTAESCTGGYIGKALTAIPGSSSTYWGGAISYHNTLKSNLLGVELEALEKYGAVSEKVARQMAEGAKKAFATDYAVSVTGIAGPGGGSAHKPVGLVFIGTAGPGGSRVSRTVFEDKGRYFIRQQSVIVALSQLLEMLG